MIVCVRNVLAVGLAHETIIYNFIIPQHFPSVTKNLVDSPYFPI